MSDDKRIKKGRMQSQTERDAEGLAAKKERESGTPDVTFPADEITGKHAGVELAELRAMRPTDERIGRLETKHDQLATEVRTKNDQFATEVSGVRVEVAKMSGKLEVLPDLVKAVEKVADRAAEQDRRRAQRSSSARARNFCPFPGRRRRRSGRARARNAA